MLRVVISAWLVCVAACEPPAQVVGRRAARGALQHVQDATAGEQMAREVVSGALDEATKPENLERVQSLVNEAAAQATDQIVDSMVQGLSRSLGDRGDGELARSLSATAEQLGASTMRGMRSEVGLFEDCSGPTREECIDRRLTSVSKAMTMGVREGLRGALSIPLFVLAFLLGIGVAMLITAGRGDRSKSSRLDHRDVALLRPRT